MSGFTKGPWVVKPNTDIEDWDIVSACEAKWDIATIMCDAGFDACGKDVSSPQTNANLIAAAPDMYEALRNVLDDLELGAHPHLYIDEIKDALAKADGETE